MNELKIVKEKIKSVKSKLKTDKKTFFLLVPAGIIVLIIAFTGVGNVGKNTDKNAKNTPENDGGTEIEYVENAVAQKIKSLVCEIDGAGNVNVSVSLESTGTIHYAQDVNEKKENDSIFKDSEYIFSLNESFRSSNASVNENNTVTQEIKVKVFTGFDISPFTFSPM